MPTWKNWPFGTAADFHRQQTSDSKCRHCDHPRTKASRRTVYWMSIHWRWYSLQIPQISRRLDFRSPDQERRSVERQFLRFLAARRPCAWQAWHFIPYFSQLNNSPFLPVFNRELHLEKTNTFKITANKKMNLPEDRSLDTVSGVRHTGLLFPAEIFQIERKSRHPL